MTANSYTSSSYLRTAQSVTLVRVQCGVLTAMPCGPGSLAYRCHIDRANVVGFPSVWRDGL